MTNQSDVATDGTMNEAARMAVAEGIEILTDAVALNNFEHGWRSPNDDPRPIGDLIALLHSEVTEAFECYRNNEPPLHYTYPGYAPARYELEPTQEFAGKIELGKPEGIASELADVIIRTLDMSQELGLDLVEAIMRKHTYNQSRPFRHGGKAV